MADTKKYFEVQLYPFQLEFISIQLPNGYSLQTSNQIRKREQRVSIIFNLLYKDKKKHQIGKCNTKI